MIEPTDEMVEAWREGLNRAAAEAVKAGAPLSQTGDIARAGLAAVLAIVARDHCLEAKGHVYHPLRREPGWPPGRGGSHPHYCVTCSGGLFAGPGCINCRFTGFDQTPWPACAGCKADAEQNREMRQSMNADGEL